MHNTGMLYIGYTQWMKGSSSVLGVFSAPTAKWKPITALPPRCSHAVSAAAGIAALSHMVALVAVPLADGEGFEAAGGCLLLAALCVMSTWTMLPLGQVWTRDYTPDPRRTPVAGTVLGAVSLSL